MSDHINDVAPLLILHTHFPKHVIDVKVASNLNATNLYNSAPSVFPLWHMLLVMLVYINETHANCVVSEFKKKY